MSAHTRERDTRPGFYAVKVSFFLNYIILRSDHSAAGDRPVSPRNNASRESWAIERSSLYQEIGADETLGRRPAEATPNFGAFAASAGQRFQQPLNAGRQPGLPLLVPRKR